MYELFFKLQEYLTPTLRSGDLLKCEATVVKELKQLPASPFHMVIDLKITNSPKKVALYFDKYFRKWNAKQSIGAAYTEMNGFDINTDYWFCNVSVFEEYGGHDGYGWLSRPKFEEYEGLGVTGLEALQEVYASDAFSDQGYGDASTLASLLVVIKFQQLIQESAHHMKRLEFPLLATAHDYDFIYEVRIDT